MVDVLLVNTGDKFDEWYVDNMAYMLDRTGFKYNAIHVIRDEQYEGVWNKLQLFRDFKSGDFIYFDLDVVLLENTEHLIRKDFTLLSAWWRDKQHTPLNSSIMSWSGDYSHFYNIFAANPEYYMMKYPGIDQYIYELDMPYNTYEPCCTSYNWQGWRSWPVMLFNQAYHKMREEGEWSKFTLSD